MVLNFFRAEYTTEGLLRNYYLVVSVKARVSADSVLLSSIFLPAAAHHHAGSSGLQHPESAQDTEHLKQALTTCWQVLAESIGINANILNQLDPYQLDS